MKTNVIQLYICILTKGLIAENILSSFIRVFHLELAYSKKMFRNET